jgi:hypothetical protein
MNAPNMRLGSQCVLVAAAFAMHHNIAVAQQDQRPPMYRLGEIVISSQLPVSERATVVRIVTEEQIAAHLEGDYGIPPGIINDPADPFARRPTYERVENVNGTALQLAGSYLPGGPINVRVGVPEPARDQPASLR